MNGRFFSGRKVEASYLQGKPKYKRSGKTDGQDDDDEAEKKRLDQFTKWLENGGEGTAPSNG
jgi:HIV Tat-specific factor 1